MVHTKITFNGQQRVAINMQGQTMQGIWRMCVVYLDCGPMGIGGALYQYRHRQPHGQTIQKVTQRRLAIFTDMVLHRRKYPGGTITEATT